MSAADATRTALIVGAGFGISAAVARALSARGFEVALASRDPGKLEGAARERGWHLFEVDAGNATSVAALFAAVDARIGAPGVVLYNVGQRLRGSLLDLDPASVEAALRVNALGGFLVAQQAARRMVERAEGALFFTGATASLKAFAQSAPFAMGKFALRALAESAARELGPRGVHVAHFIIDGGVRSQSRPVPSERPDSLLDPDAIAKTYLDVLAQPRSAWSFEVELRPWVESF
jgi:NAD(P)-dependent dehydrogenase (short-subunit alcohol dehydrogenase family)